MVEEAVDGKQEWDDILPKENMRKLIYIVAFLLLTNISYAQDDGRNKIMSFSDWSGGIATKMDDVSTNPKYARIAENVRLNTSLQAISKRDQTYTYGTVTPSEPITGLHRLYKKDFTKYLLVNHGDQLDVGNDIAGTFTKIADYSIPNYRWQWVTWHDLGIGMDGFNQPIKTNASDTTYLGSLYAEPAGSGAGPNGTYTYKVSCHATTQALEFDQISNSTSPANEDVNLSMIPIGPDAINGEAILYRKVYRNTVANPTTWYLLTNGKIANNTAVTLVDSDADAGIGAETYSTNPAGVTEEVWTAPKGKLCVIHKNRLWISNNPDYPSRLYYSEDGSHDLFDPLGYFDIRTNDGDEITFIKNLLGVLRVGKTNTIQNIYTDKADTADWEISDPFSHIGCDAIYSATDTATGILYLSRVRSGIYSFNGQASILRSEQATPEVQDILNSNLTGVWGQYNNNMYYLAYPSLRVGGSTNNRVLVYDMLANAFTIDTLSINCFTSFNGLTDSGDLCAGSSTDGKIYTFANTSNTIIHNKFADFANIHPEVTAHPAAWTHARYQPVMIGGDPNSPVLEIAWDIDCHGRTWSSIDGLPGRVDRMGNLGTYESIILNTTGASSYDKFFWNQVIPSTHAAVAPHVSVAVRGGNTHTELVAAAWSSEFDNPAGSDLSAFTAYNYTQYKLFMGTNDLSYSPNITTLGGYTVKLTYNKVGTPAESAIALHWQTGYLDFGFPANKKELRKIIVYHEGTNGTLTIKLTNEYGESDTFNVDLSTNPTKYEEYFTTGALVGTKFKMDLENSDLNALKIKEILIIYDVAPTP